MVTLSQPRMKRMVAIHGWAGVCLGGLLYVLVVTGTVAVFAPQIARWSAGEVRHAPPLHGPVDDAVRRLVAGGETVRLWAGPGNDLYAAIEAADSETVLRIDARTGLVRERHEGLAPDDAAAREPSALRHFLVDLHVRLTMPDPWGVVTTGLLGLMLTASVTSGLLIHRHLWRDLFLAERPGGRLASVRDRHVLAGAWTLPFALLLGLTGVSLGLGSTVVVPLLAAVGDREAVEAVLAGASPHVDPTPVPLADLDAMIAESIAIAGSPVAEIAVAHAGRADARVTIRHEPLPGELLDAAHLFGATGAFLGRQAPIGVVSATGLLYGVMEPLHFGDFLGLASQLVWGGLGAATAFVILSGLRLWVRRRADVPLWQAFDRSVQVLGFGLPLAMLGAAAGFFLSRPAHDPFLWTPVAFWVTAAATAAFGMRLPASRVRPVLLRLLMLACLALPLLRLAAGGISWAHALMAHQFDILGVDLALLAAGGLLWRRSQLQAPPLHPEPAE